MNLFSEILPAQRTRLIMSLAFCAALALISLNRLPSIVRSAQENNERKFDNTIPAHVPIRVKLKNEQTFKDLKNKNWAREFEVEIKNTRAKAAQNIDSLNQRVVRKDEIRLRGFMVSAPNPG